MLTFILHTNRINYINSKQAKEMLKYLYVQLLHPIKYVTETVEGKEHEEFYRVNNITTPYDLLAKIRMS